MSIRNTLSSVLLGFLVLNLIPTAVGKLQADLSLDETLDLLLSPQDKKEPQEADKPRDEDPPAETKIVKITVGQRPASVYNITGFKPNEPLNIEGKAADAETLRAAVVKGIEYILKEQSADGSWRFNAKTQMRKGIKTNGFLSTAAQSMNKIVLTSLCCMALRRHEELDPEHIPAAVEKGLRYVIQKAPTYSRGRFSSYAPWTWAFSLTFLCEESKLAKDPALQADIKTAAKGVVQLMVEGQHKKKFTPKAVAKAAKKPEPQNGKPAETKEQPKLPSNGGYFGIYPSENDDVGKEGVLIQGVEPKGPASKAGMTGGDRIVKIGDVDIEDMDQLYELIDSFKPGDVIKVKVLRSKQPAKKTDKRTMIADDDGDLFQQQQRRRQASKAPEDGGWSYYVMQSVSFTTATCVLALLDAQDMGIDVPQDAIDRGISVIEGLKMQRAGSDEIGFGYHTGVPIGTGRSADVRGSVGRLAVCGLALLRTGKETVGELGKALEVFANRRGELDKVRGYPGNHFVRSFLNAAYYYLYAHFYSAMAVNKLPDAQQRKKLGIVIQEALLKSRNEEGLWTDHEMWGQLYGTSMALMGLGELKELAPSVYKVKSGAGPETGKKK